LSQSGDCGHREGCKYYQFLHIIYK
jgi:hypothetical protein